jgi:predicted MPP superfamily phosphohydrolase
MTRTSTTAREREHARLLVEAFCGRFGEWALAYRLLARHAALPLVLTPELVSYLRNHFLRGQAPWVAESDLLLSDLCREVAYEQYVMDQAVRAVLIDELRRDSALGKARMAEVARLLIGYIRSLARTDHPLPSHELQAQQWAAMVYMDDKRESAARQIAAAFSGVLGPGGGGGVDRTELARLANLTQTLAPELAAYRELVSYGRNVARLLGDVTGKVAAELDRNGQLDSFVRVLDAKLPNLRGLAPMQAGAGPLPTESPIYIERQADRQAWDALQRMEYIMLLAPRQQGKTSLINQLRRQCETAGYTFVFVDMMPLLGVPSESAWYDLLSQSIMRELNAIEGSRTFPAPTNGATWFDFLCLVAEVSFQRAKPNQRDFRAKLLQGLTDHFNEEELRTLCFDMGLDYESLPAQGKVGRAREIVAQVERNGRIPNLIERCRLLRPNVSWTGMLEIESGVPTFPSDSIPERQPSERPDPAKHRLVIAFDEIGAIPKDWSTGFFAAIQSAYYRCRERLTIILAGTIDPREMISDPRIAPFNIGTAIPLRDFTQYEVQSLVTRLGAAEATEELAGRIYDWTGGQPYLCQKLCQYLTEVTGEVDVQAVDAAVDRLFMEDMNHLPGLIRNLEARPDLLKYLCKVLKKAPKTRFAPTTNSYHYRLTHLVGIIASDQPFCQVRNRIYQRALDEAGMCSNLPSMRLRYLHISDLHLIGQPKDKSGWETEQFNQELVTRSMLDAIEVLVKRQDKSLDLIFITGDLAKRGRPEDYKVVEVFCRRLLEVTGVPAKRLFLVPGNHDVDRGQVDQRHRKLWYDFKNQDEIADILGSDISFPALMRKFAAFNDFASRMLGRRVFSEREYFLAETVLIPKEGKTVRVNVMGLNSALFAGYDGDDRGRLALGLPQVEAALQKFDKEPHLTIALFHHPFSCFHPADRVCRNLLMQRADLILTGHLHEPENMFVQNSAGQAVLMGAGPSFETRESENLFNVVEIDLETGAGEVQFYKYLPDSHLWKANTHANPNNERGIFQFTVERLARQAWQVNANAPKRV